MSATQVTVLILASALMPDVNIELKRAGYQLALHAQLVSAFEPSRVSPKAESLETPAQCVALVDTQLLQTVDSVDAVCALAAKMPLALLTRSPIGHERVGLESVAAVAALPFPPDSAVLIASLPYWHQRHQELKVLKEVERDLQSALASSRAIGQAVGMMAERHGLSTAEAFELIRANARSHRQRVERVAQSIIDEAEERRPSSVRPEPVVDPSGRP